eukprot:gene27894-12014_t
MTPQQEGMTPQQEGRTHQQEGRTPQKEGVPRQQGGTAPQREGITTQHESVPHQQGGTTAKQGGTTAKQEGSPAQESEKQHSKAEVEAQEWVECESAGQQNIFGAEDCVQGAVMDAISAAASEFGTSEANMGAVMDAISAAASKFGTSEANMVAQLRLLATLLPGLPPLFDIFKSIDQDLELVEILLRDMAYLITRGRSRGREFDLSQKLRSLISKTERHFPYWVDDARSVMTQSSLLLNSAKKAMGPTWWPHHSLSQMRVSSTTHGNNLNNLNNRNNFNNFNSINNLNNINNLNYLNTLNNFRDPHGGRIIISQMLGPIPYLIQCLTYVGEQYNVYNGLGVIIDPTWHPASPSFWDTCTASPGRGDLIHLLIRYPSLLAVDVETLQRQVDVPPSLPPKTPGSMTNHRVPGLGVGTYDTDVNESVLYELIPDDFPDEWQLYQVLPPVAAVLRHLFSLRPISLRLTSPTAFLSPSSPISTPPCPLLPYPCPLLPYPCINHTGLALPPLDVDAVQYGGAWASANSLVFLDLMKHSTPFLAGTRSNGSTSTFGWLGNEKIIWRPDGYPSGNRSFVTTQFGPFSYHSATIQLLCSVEVDGDVTYLILQPGSPLISTGRLVINPTPSVTGHPAAAFYLNGVPLLRFALWQRATGNSDSTRAAPRVWALRTTPTHSSQHVDVSLPRAANSSDTYTAGTIADVVAHLVLGLALSLKPCPLDPAGMIAYVASPEYPES